MIALLNGSKNSEIIERLSYFDSSWTVTYSAYPTTTPALASTPVVDAYTYNAILVT